MIANQWTRHINNAISIAVDDDALPLEGTYIPCAGADIPLAYGIQNIRLDPARHINDAINLAGADLTLAGGI